MATVYIQGNPFMEAAERLDELKGDLRSVVAEGLEEIGEQITEDTRAALSAGNLPARGKYSKGKTEASIVEANIVWSGDVCELPVGFDKTMPGAGGFLITGTPKMAPVASLQKIYKQKAYMRKMQKKLTDKVKEEIAKLGE